MWDRLPCNLHKYCKILCVSSNDIEGWPCEAVENFFPNAYLHDSLMLNDEEVYSTKSCDDVVAYSSPKIEPDYQAYT